VIKEPRGRGGQNPHWAAEPKKMMVILQVVIALFIDHLDVTQYEIAITFNEGYKFWVRKVHQF
jgi:hypothetical protein